MALVAQSAGPAVMVADENAGSPTAVSWAAVIAGALAAVAITLLLVALGSGIGLSSVSPWTALNPSATTFTLLAAVWLIIVQWLSSAMGGYLAGRLRTKWAGVHTDEVFFRDTAHGFLAWALASILVVAFATSSISSAVSSAGRAISNAAGSAASTATQAATSQASGSDGYFLDTMFRKSQPDANATPPEVRSEASRILARSVANGSLDPGDRAYLAKLVAARTGISQQDAEKRIDDTVAQMKAAEDKAKQAADAARKASAQASFYLFFSMLIGAFIASTAGAIGGRQRDL
ncbi:MAG TPA: hypothetical protein VL614_30665 [Acetobacteraceae bacterium]|jgi:hypothetical protein|nr:hypothetical protein [Acetobacteraceae bacterium]